jgi:methyl-accepting chemotaxis protein
MFNNLKISTRLTATLALLVAVMLAIAGTAWWQMKAIHEVTHEITSNWLPSVERVNQMNTSTSDFRIAEFQHVLNTDEAAMAGIEKTMAKVLADFEEDHQAYIQLISSAEERQLYNDFAAEWKQYLALHDKVLALSRQNQNAEAKALLEGDSRKLFDSSSAKLMKLVELNSAGAKTSTADADQAFATARNSLLAGLGLALLLAAAAGVWLVRSITRPLNQALEAADRVAAGDLTGHIDTSSEDETGQVLRALERMQTSLAKVVSEVRQNSESVATASAQIAQGNQDLSGRTEEQASALQQTAATMEELGTTVRHNADSANQASQLAQGASSVAMQGGEVVGRVVSTMKGITDSSRKIGDIISVIDGIAFQTNILALNAAVEAARAGEQGRGFAVVAGEVRTLAQRSAEAAREIKTLINHSVEQVEQGTVLVDQAGKTMDEIVGSIRRVTDIVAEIASASSEQSTGVQQVGEAVGQMDQATQQNAALVEESAAAAESLKGQAMQLVQAVAVFKLSAHEPAAVAAPRPMASRPAPSYSARPAPTAAAAAAAPRPVAPAPATASDDWESF